MRRQRVRRTVLLVSFVLFPVTIWYFSPYLIIDGATQGIVTGSFLVFAFLLSAAFVLGRGFCGWVCPVGGLQEACFPINSRPAKGARLNWIKYLIWGPWMGIIILTIVRSGGMIAVDPLYQTEYGISLTQPASYVMYGFVVGIVISLALFAGRRAFCHYGCWIAPFMVIGSRVGNLLHVPGLRLRSDKNSCVECNACTKSCPMSLNVMSKVQGNSMTDSECILCGACVDGCPKNAIRFALHNRR